MIVCLTSQKISAPIVLAYEVNKLGENVLVGVQSLPDLTSEQHKYLFRLLHDVRVYPENGRFGAFKAHLNVGNANDLIKAKKAGTKQKKIKLFCGLYKNVMGIQYEVKPWDAKMVDQTEFNPELIRIFLENEFWFNRDGNKTIQCYCKNINSLRLHQSGAANREFPLDYDPALEKILSGDKLKEYWRHLREQGWSPRKMPGRGISGWEHKDGRYTSKY